MTETLKQERFDFEATGLRARAAATILSGKSESERNHALRLIAAALTEQSNSEKILKENEQDMQNARSAGREKAFLDRLSLTSARIDQMASGVLEVVALPDPVGVVTAGRTLANGIKMTKIKVPFGVVGMIYEARPNVTVDAAALCLKSGNVCLLRGSKDAFFSNRVLVAVMRRALIAAELPEDCVQLVEDVSREGAMAMMQAKGTLDLLIPRGGAGLIRSVVENARVPVIETGVGNCHTYVDQSADLQMAVRIADNAKTSRPSVCNAMETLLVHQAVAAQFLPLAKAALDRSHVEWRGCEETCRMIPGCKKATHEDFAAEFGDYILAVKVVRDLDEAIAHIRRYTSGHSECIVTGSYQNSQRFVAQIDAAAIYVNASTRFTDGRMFGLGAEIGISTQKLHTRGPMGLCELVTDKYILLGDGQIRE